MIKDSYQLLYVKSYYNRMKIRITHFKLWLFFIDAMSFSVPPNGVSKHVSQKGETRFSEIMCHSITSDSGTLILYHLTDMLCGNISFLVLTQSLLFVNVIRLQFVC